MKRMLAGFALAILVVALFGCAPATVASKEMVQIAYTGTLADGTVFSKSADGKPMEFLVGGSQLLPALEKGLMGMKVGEKRTVTLKAADAYGEYDTTARKEFPRSQLPPDVELKVGNQYQFTTPAGPIVVTLLTLSKTTVTMDFNHPLAGKDLTFAVTVVKIRPATKEELAPASSAVPTSTQ